MPTDSLPAPFFAPGDYDGVPKQVPTQFTPTAPSNVNTPNVPLPLPEGSDNPKHVQVFAYDPLSSQFKPVNWVDGQLSVDATFSGSISVGAVTLKDGASGTLGSIIPVGAVNAQVVTVSATQAAIPVTIAGGSFDVSENLAEVGGAPIALGQAAMAASLPVVIASNQTALPVSGTVAVSNFPASQPVSGTITANQGGAPWSQNITEIGGSSVALGQALMAASLPVVMASDYVQSPSADLSASGTITALNGSVTLPIHGCGSAIFTVTGTWAGTLALQGLAADGATWLSLVGNTGSTGTYAVQNAISANGSYKVINIASFMQIRATATAFSSGPISVGIVAASPVQRNEVVQLNAANLNATVSGSVSVSNFPASQPVSGTVTANTQADVALASQTITVQDTGSTSTVVADGQTWYSGTPTAGSAATFAMPSCETAQLEITGTWTGTLQVEVSGDGTTWVTRSLHVGGTAILASSFTANIFGAANVGGKSYIRVRAIAAITGTATVSCLVSNNPTLFYIANSLRLCDTSNPLAVQTMVIKPASTPAAAADASMVVAMSPNSPLPAGTNALGTVAAQTVDVPVSAPVNITAQDTATTATVVAITSSLNQTMYSGTPTTGSAAIFPVGTYSYDTAQVNVSGTWTGTIQVETSDDGGVTYVSHSLHIISSSLFLSSFTTNVIGSANMGGKTHIRVRAIAAWTGTAAVRVVFSNNPTSIYVANALRITDGATSVTSMAVKPASTPAAATDPAAVVTTQRASTLNTNQVSVGNTPTLIIAANTSRKRIVITNLGTTNVFIGGSAVTTTTGQLLQGLAGYPLALYCTGAIYGVATPNQSVAYSEEAI